MSTAAAHGSRNVSTAAAHLREKCSRCVCVVGGGFSGLASALLFAEKGFGVLIIDTAPAGGATGSAAAAGLLDPLSPKGKVLWAGTEALAAAKRLLARCDQCSKDAESRPSAVQTPCLHVPRGQKDAAALQEAAEKLDPAFDATWCRDASSLEGAHGVRLPLGGLLCRRNSLVVDSGVYLRRLWEAIQQTTAALWLKKRIEHCQALSELFDVVILAAGSGLTRITEARHLPLDLSRGQVLEYSRPALGPGSEPPAALPDDETLHPASAVHDEQPAHLEQIRLLQVALVGAAYVVPHMRRLDCGGTYESIHGGQQSQAILPRQPAQATLRSTPRRPLKPSEPDAAVAEAMLAGQLTELFPPIGTLLGHTQRVARAGVRAAPPRTELGSVPLAARAHTGAGVRNVWLIGGLGSRGLLYHAILAEWLVDAAVSCDATKLPEPVRRCGFGELLCEKLAVLAARQQKATREGEPIVEESGVFSNSKSVPPFEACPEIHPSRHRDVTDTFVN